MSQQPIFDGLSDMMLLGEFCEKDGPVVREVWGLDSEPINIYDIPGASKVLHTFMMRAMSGDHVYPEGPESPLQCRSCEVLMDRVKWVDGSMMVAYICSVTLYDLYARGYARTACIAYLSPDDHKMFTISHWLGLECQVIAKTLFDASLDRHKRELLRSLDAVEKAKLVLDSSTPTALTERITDRHRNAIGAELEALRARFLRLPGLAPIPPSPNLLSSTAASSEVRRRKTTMTRLAQTALGTPDEVGTMRAGGGGGGIQPSSSFDARVAELRNSSLSSDSFVSPVSDDEIVEILDALITKKGTGELRTLRDLCGFDEFEKSSNQMRRTVWTFSQDTVWLMENVLQVMMPLARVLERPLGELLTANWTWADSRSHSGTPSESRGSHSAGIKEDVPQTTVRLPRQPPDAFYFKIGDCLVVEPSLRMTPPFPPMNSLTAFTMIHEEGFFHALKEHGVTSILTVIFNALRCVPIIVCGDDAEDVAMAMRIAATFVPGLFQSKQNWLQAAMCNFPMKHRVAPEHLLRYALIGCPTEAILFDGKPIYPSACVWQVQKAQRDKKGALVKGRTANIFGSPYNVLARAAMEHRAGPAAFVDPFGLDAVHIPFGVGLLHEVHDILNIKSTSPAEEMALSNFLRLTVKRIFLEYGTMAALVMQSLVHEAHMASRPSLNSGHFNNNSITSPDHNLRASHLSFNSSMSTVLSSGHVVSGPPVYSHKTPYVMCENDVRGVLETHHGYHQLHTDDVTIVTGMLGRLMSLAHEYEPTAQQEQPTQL